MPPGVRGPAALTGITAGASLVAYTSAPRASTTSLLLAAEHTATEEVLVAADARVTNDQSQGREQLRQHRLRLVMVERDGRWLTERLEFVR